MNIITRILQKSIYTVEKDMESSIMKTTTFWILLKFFLVFGFVCALVSTASAQNYYPANIGNEWVLESTDGKERRTYSLEQPKNAADQKFVLLKIETENLRNNKVIDTDNYFLTDEDEGIKLHKTVLEQAPYGNVTADFPTPVIFFPKVLVLGEKWDIVANAELLGIPIKSTTNLEVVEFEDVVTPVGTFRNCAKIELVLKTSAAGGVINIDPTTSYQWLAPDVGPIKFENSDGLVYEITSFKLSGPPVREAQGPPVWQLPSLEFQVTGSRLGGILNAKILENVEDYASEVHNLGIVAVTGGIVPPGDGTGFVTNLQRRQDLWVAGIFGNAPIIGTVTLFAENDKGRATVTIKVTIIQ